MQVLQQQRTFDTTGVSEVLEAEVELSTYFFDMLSGLYSDTIGAIMREYSTNMYDGHVRRGLKLCKHDPIIHLPTPLEPWIEFKDFGSGMSPEDVRGIFRRYGASTKRGSNDEVGGMGLGSKVAFAYKHVDQWTFETRWHGKRHIWAATRNTHGIPVFVPLDTLDTLEPNGVTVRIPVARGDFAAFQEAAKKYLRFYPIPVKITGAGDFTMPTREAQYTGTNWEILKQSIGPTNATVVMGNVPYPIENKYTDEAFGSKNWSENLGALVVFLPIGSLSLVPSREALKYDEATIRTLRQAFKTIKAEMLTLVENEIASAPNRWLAARALVDQQKVYWFRNLGNHPRYKGEELTVFKAVTRVRDNLRKDDFSMLRWYKPRSTKKGYDMDDVKDTELSFNVQTDTLLVLHDLAEPLDKTIAARMRQYIIKTCLRDTTYRGNATYRVERDMHILLLRTARTPEQVTEYFDGIPCVRLSTFPVPPKAPAAPRDRSKPKQVILPLKRFHLPTFEWMDAHIDPSTVEEALFYPLAANEATEPAPFTSRSIIGHVHRAFAASGIFTGTVYGIPRSHKSVERMPGWTSIADPIWKQRVEEALAESRDDLAVWRGYEQMFEGTVGTLLLKALSEASDDDVQKVLASGKSVTLLPLLRSAMMHKKFDALDTLAIHYVLQDQMPEAVPPTCDLAGLFAAAPVLSTMRDLLNVIPSNWASRAIDEIPSQSLAELRQYVFAQVQ